MTEEDIETPENVIQEYIQAMKYHVGHDCLILKEVNNIHREVVKYIKEKGEKNGT